MVVTLTTLDFAVLALAVAVVAYFLGKLFTLQAQATQMSLFATLSSISALVQSKGLASAPVLRQVIERYVPGPAASKSEVEAKMAEMQSTFGDLWGLNTNPLPKQSTDNSGDGPPSSGPVNEPSKPMSIDDFDPTKLV